MEKCNNRFLLASSGGSGKSAYKEIQQRIEVQHEEERGRRLAQEIKGFNWLEQKIKNSSLNPPTTTTTISSLPNRTPALVPRKNFLSRTLSSPASGFGSSSWPLLTSSAVCKKNEPDFRRNSFTGTSGLKGHLQTAVPPLLPSSRVTALPKRRASPPFLSQPSSTGESVTVTGTTLNSSPSTVRGNIDTTMGVLCGPVQSSGLATYTIAGVSPESLYSSSECDKVTLYSSTDSNKATVYGIPDPQLEVLYEDTEVRTTSSHGDTQDSRKNCENIIPVTVQHLSESPSSEMSSQPFNSSAAEKQDDWNNLQKGEDHNPPVRTPSSDPPASANGAACGPSIGVRFSHKQALLKRAFSNMLKSSESSPDCSEENNNPFPPTNTVDKKSQDTNEHALVIDDRATDASPFKVPVSSVDENSQCLTESTEAKTHDQNEALDTASQSNTKLTSETKIVKSEISDSNAESLHVKTEISKESENNISVDSLEKFEEKILKCLPAGTEEKVSGQGKEREVGGMNPTHIFSMLYEELKKTRQEVERLRKRQEELMHTEKNDRRDDEQKETEEKVVIQMETPQSPQVIDIKSEEEEAATEKTARISIRNDLLATVKDTPLQRQVISPNRVQSVINTKGAISANAGAVAEQPIISPLPKTSPSVPHLGPASCRASPGSSQASPLTRTSPLVSPQLSSQGLSQAELSVVNTSLGPPMSSPTVTQRCASSSPYSTPSVINHGLPRSSPVIMSSPLFSRCSPRSSVSPGIPRSSPGVLSNSTTAKSSEVPKDKNLVEMMPSRLRSAFGINMDVEVMAVTGGNRPPLTEPQPQTYLQVIGDQQYRQESPLLLDAVRAQAFESIKNSDKDRNLLHNMVPYKLPIPHESTKRFHLSQPVENEVKRSRMSTSDLPEFPSTSQKPPPLKPVVTVHRRYSEGSESHKMEATVVPVPHPNVQGVPASTSEHNIVATSCPYTIPSSSPSQHPANRNIDNTLDRKMKYQALSAQYAHFQQHLGSSPPVMRSLGPDKATIIPIPTPHPNPQNIHPFGKPFSAPASRAPSLDHHHPTRIEHSLSPEEYSNSLYFQKMKQTVQHNYEASLSTTKERGPVTVGQERLPIPSKTMQPQTFAPRVLVRESVPENPLHMLPPPPPSFTNSLFPPDCNPHVSNVGRGHYLNNTLHHSSQHPNVQHMVTSGLLMSGLKGSSATPATAKSNPRSIAGGPSGNGEKKRCLNCPQQARFLCSGCKKAWYCSETCQLNSFCENLYEVEFFFVKGKFHIVKAVD
ncbi:hypothetical protein SK128_007059 [Halocaridina rubra]|uniref:Uncharacterized protein n=1 Tax=Halocaridina rubra TaxID=373956 RepID=A0AAN9FX64_HALRR